MSESDKLFTLIRGEIFVGFPIQRKNPNPTGKKFLKKCHKIENSGIFGKSKKNTEIFIP